ncbi:MAG: hypothetical protein OJI67_00825 [Prosthecobacter sp.]|nr:hypothetical protein [Prosthecobacter sp.]
MGLALSSYLITVPAILGLLVILGRKIIKHPVITIIGTLGSSLISFGIATDLSPGMPQDIAYITCGSLLCISFVTFLFSCSIAFENYSRSIIQRPVEPPVIFPLDPQRRYFIRNQNGRYLTIDAQNWVYAANLPTNQANQSSFHWRFVPVTHNGHPFAAIIHHATNSSIVFRRCMDGRYLRTRGNNTISTTRDKDRFSFHPAPHPHANQFGIRNIVASSGGMFAKTLQGGSFQFIGAFTGVHQCEEYFLLSEIN